eukprot:g5197.t1
MSSAVWDAGEAATGEAAAVAAAAAAPAAGDWNPASAAGMGGNEPSQAGSGYPETKDNGMDDTGHLFGNDLASKSEQAMTQQGDRTSEPAAVVVGSLAAPAAGRGNSGAFATNASGGTAYPSATTTLAKRRNSMAFEIARMERAGKTLPPANPQKARRVWELSRPRYVEEASDHGPSIGGSGGGRGAKRRVRVPPGVESRDAVPYGVWSTSWAQMGDFGLDVGMYFVTLAQLVGAVLVYAALCVVAMVHFSSEQYSGPQDGVRPDLRGSAVCTASKSVLAYEDETFTLSPLDRNDCPLDAKQGYADMAGVLLLFLLLLLLGKAQEKAAEFADTQIHSAQPYTVKVSSPDPLADDPDRWRRLFAQFGHVSYVTVARGNGALLRAMYKRREAGRKLEGSTADVAEVVDAYRAVDEKERPSSGPGGWWKALFQPFGLFRDTNYWKQQLWATHDQVECEVMQGMHDQGLPVVKVFVTFESDLSQTRCLSHMSRGILEAPEEQHMYTNPDGFKKALHVMPASPASEVLYENLHVGPIQRAAAQLLTFALTLAVVVLAYVVARALQTVGVWATAVLIAVMDVLLPSLVRLFCCLERHHNAVTHDVSIMNKLTLARWANLVAIPFFLNERLLTLSADNLELVISVLWLNAFIPPAVRVLDLRGRWSRSVRAKKEVVQSAMDSHFEGSRFHLSERYTDTTKTMFACLAYAPVLPIAMWLCLLSLALSYWADKWLFMKAWRTPQPPGNSGRVARLARRHLALAVLAHCVLALYYYAGWPFDGICRFERGWIECSQEGTGIVEAETQVWMTGPQKTLVDVFSALNVAWLVILLVFYYLQSIMRGISLVVKGAPRKLRSRQHMPFSQLTSRYQHEVDAYVPQINTAKHALPLLACDLDLLEPETIPWQLDGQKGDSFEDYCLSSSRDMPRISRYQRARLFSLCVHYPPPAPFEAIGNGRASKTDMDWFRRPPPPGLQETKIPEINADVGISKQMGRQQQQQQQQQRQRQRQQQRGDDVPMEDIPALVDPDYVSSTCAIDVAMRSAVSGTSGRSGRSGLCLTPRVEHGDEVSDIVAGEGADEYLQRKRAPPRDPTAPGAGMAPVAGPDEEDGELSYYEEGSRVQEVVDTFANLPTPLPAPEGGEAEGGEGGGPVMGADGNVVIRSQRSNSSEGWVDQYTNSSTGGSREDLVGVGVAAATAAAASSNE